MSRTVQYHDLSYGPQGLWLLNRSLTDLSDNELTLSIEAGTERYASPVPGIEGFFFDGSTNLVLPVGIGANAPLQVTGDLTIQMLAVVPVQTAPAHLIFMGASGELEAANILYQWSVNPPPSTFVQHEFGDGNNTSFTSNNSITDGNFHLHCLVRENDVYSHYVDNQLLWQSGTLTAPTGGSSGQFRIGASATGGMLNSAVISSVKFNDFALSQIQRTNEYNRTMGPVFGFQ